MHNLELVKRKNNLEKDVAAQERAALLSRQYQEKNDAGENVVEHHQYTITAPDGSTYSTFELKTIMNSAVECAEGGHIYWKNYSTNITCIAGDSERTLCVSTCIAG